MQFRGTVSSSQAGHRTEVAIGERRTTIQIAPKASGRGSGVSGGELLMLALATCCCNDIYREAAKMGIEVSAVDVECQADFGAEGEPASNITYEAKISARASEAQIHELAARADTVAEIQNTVRAAIPVTLGRIEAVSA